MDVKFFRTCVTLVSDNPTESAPPELVLSAQRYRQARSPLCTPASTRHLRSIKEYLAKQMVTDTKNHVSTNLYQRCRRHLRKAYELDGSQAYLMLKDLFRADRGARGKGRPYTLPRAGAATVLLGGPSTP